MGFANYRKAHVGICATTETDYTDPEQSLF
jgi:hypothetical protein